MTYLFQEMSKLQDTHKIKDFQITKSSLEEVFSIFARMQESGYVAGEDLRKVTEESSKLNESF